MERWITEEGIKEFKNGLIEDEKSKATIEKYVRDMRTFWGFVDGKSVDKELVIQYKQYLMEKYAITSVNSMLASINRFFKMQGWYECIVKPLRVQRQGFRLKERELKKEEYYCLLEAAKQKKNTRLYFLMQTICSTGIRVSELRFITLEAVNCGRAVVSLKGKSRIVLIPSKLCDELKGYAKECHIHGGSIFITRSGKPMDRSNILHEMKSLCEVAKVDQSKVFPHNLRHLFACQFYQAEKDISHLADILGHSNINTTRIYTCVSGEEQSRKIEKLGLVIGLKIPKTPKIPHNIHYVVKR